MIVHFPFEIGQRFTVYLYSPLEIMRSRYIAREASCLSHLHKIRWRLVTRATNKVSCFFGCIFLLYCIHGFISFDCFDNVLAECPRISHSANVSIRHHITS